MIAVRSSMEFEPEWLHLLEEIQGKPCIPVGMLPTTDYDTGEEIDTWSSIKQWLDNQGKGSVVYVAFGSEAKPSQIEITEIALGLELCGLPFFWVLRKRRGLADTEVVELPDGFEERTKGRGVALQHEKALILLPFLGDQGLNVRILEEKKLGYPIPRNELDGSFTRKSVAESVRLAMVEEEGKIYREKAKEMRIVWRQRKTE
ncbi:hypothetical protein GH714_042344 [Hevea brasiliensis]|uniref:Uncharacterized protein n=1 Tax=Hevea brasiliensis TaxID=3981 RepID=A0A6A6K926_HEVBR|nr:hypothetical protein GH714_042344 [Hevea brasiliensis]